MNHPLTLRLALLLTLPPLMWAGNAVVGRLAVGAVPPVALNLVRWVLAFLILLPWGWHALRDTASMRRHGPWLLLVGLLGMGSYNTLQYLALHTSTPVNVTLIAASMPAWMLGIGALFYRERPSRAALSGAALSMAGVLMVISRGDPAVLAQLHFVPGDLLMLLAAMTWGFYSWQLARPPAAFTGEHRPAWNWAGMLQAQMAFGILGSAVGSGIEMAVSDAAWVWSWQVAAIIAFVAVGPSLIAYRCWGLGVATVGPAMAAFFSNLTPVFAALMSAWLLGQPPRWYHVAAFVLIVAGIVVSSRRPAARA